MRSSMRRKQQARKALSMLLVKSFSCLFSKVTLFILIGVGACWGRALFILHSKLMNVGSGVSALLSKRELGKANSLLGRARGLVK